jgi:hypothetical protein
VAENGSLVMATISAPGANVNLSDSTAYSLRRTAGGAGSGAAHGGRHTLLWLFLAGFLAIVIWAVHRVFTKPAS